MPKSLIGLGANLDGRATTLQNVVRQLSAVPDLTISGLSRVYETKPIGGPSGQNAFLNAAVLVDSNHSPSTLLALLKKLETTCGRTKGQRWGPRVIDLDLLLYDDETIELPDLILPHPRMTFRRFVLHPACNIASEITHPTTGQTLGQLLNHLDKSPDYILFRGGTVQEQEDIMDEVQEKLISHGITLQRKITKSISTDDSAACLRHDKFQDSAAWESKFKSSCILPKLIIYLDPFKNRDPHYQLSELPAFSGPRLDLKYSKRTHIPAGDEVSAAILAMTELPRPVTDISI